MTKKKPVELGEQSGVYSVMLQKSGATVRNRLDVYEKSTSPLIDYYRGCDLLVSIDGDRDPNVVYADVKKALEL